MNSKKKITVIHPTDESTDFLKVIYSDKDVNLIDHYLPKDELRDAISESDIVWMFGHGTPDGLLGYGSYVIDHSFGDLLKEKQCVSIWCHAVYYCMRHKIRGLQTGMIVSEESECLMYGLPTDESLIWESNALFSLAVKEHIHKVNPAFSIREEYTSETNPIIKFNRRNILNG